MKQAFRSLGFMDYYSAIVNAHVHILMYAYYFMSSFRRFRTFSSKLRPVITSIQLIQLIAVFGNFVVALLPNCGKTKLFFLQAVHVVILLAFFTHFFIKSYTKKNKKIV